MQYLALLYDAESEASEPGSPQWDADLERYERFGAVAGDGIVGGEALGPSTEAVTIRHRDGGSPAITDGPYTEAAEVVGGFFVFEAEDLDAVIEVARHIPAAEDGAVEVRPLVQWFQTEADPSAGARYLALLAGPENEASEPDSPAWAAAVEGHERFAARAGVAVVGGGALQPASAATTLRVRDGELLLSDGPFTEATEVVGGLYLLQAGSRDAAAEIASWIPMSSDGMVEVRPIVEMDG